MKILGASPLPWHWKQNNTMQGLRDSDERIMGFYVPRGNNKHYPLYLRESIDANAELIVRAVNNHQALLEACKGSLKWFDDVYPADVFTGESEDIQAIRIRNLREACRTASAAAEAKQ